MPNIRAPIKGIPSTAQVDILLRYPLQQLDAQGVPAPEYRLRSPNGGVDFLDLATNTTPDVPASGPADPYPTEPVEVQITVAYAGRSRTGTMHILPVQIGGVFDLTKPVAPLGWIAPASLEALIARTETAAGAAESAATRADAAATLAEQNAFFFDRSEPAWVPGLQARRGQVLTYLDTVWVALEDNDGQEPGPASLIWRELIPRGRQGLPGVPGTVNGIDATDLALWTNDPIPNSEAPPSSWPRGVRTFDLRTGPVLGYPFAQATLTSRGADDGLTQQEALVTETVRGELMTTLWLRSSLTASEWRPWRKGTGEDSLSSSAFVQPNKVVNGSGELGIAGWEHYGPTPRRLTFQGAHEAESGPLLEATSSGAALTTFEGFITRVPIWMLAGDQYFVTVALTVVSVFPILKIVERNGSFERVRYEQVLGPGINTVGPFGAGNNTQGGTLEVTLYYPPGTVAEGLLTRFRVGVGYGQPIVPGDTRASVRFLYDDLQAFKLAGGTAQLAQNSLGASSAATLYPEGLSYLPTTGAGWPFAGVVETVRPRTATDPAATRQTIRQTGGTGLQQRTATAAGGWSAWTPYADKGTRGSKWLFGVGHPDQAGLTDVQAGDAYQEQVTGNVYIRGAAGWPSAPTYNNKGATGVSSYTRERRTGGSPGQLCVLINGVYQPATPANSVLELDSWVVIGADNIAYAPGAEVPVDGLGFQPGMYYYLGNLVNGKNLFPFSGTMPTEALATQAQRQFSPCSTPRGISNRLILNAAAEPIDVELVAQVYRFTPLSVPFDTDLGPNGLSKVYRNIDVPRTGQTVGSGYSLRTRKDSDTGVTGQNTVGQASPHVHPTAGPVFLRLWEYDNTFHTYTFNDWPETDDGDLLVAWQCDNVSYRPGVQFRATGDHTAPSLYYVQLTGTGMDLRKRVTVNGVVTDSNIVSVAKAVSPYQINLTHVRAQGSLIQVRNWVAPAGWHLPGANLQEPAAWDIERTDTSISGSGRWGAKTNHSYLRLHAASLATLDGAASF